MVFIKHNSLKSDIFFNPTFIPCFSGSMLFRVQVFLVLGFSGSRFFRVRVQGSGKHLIICFLYTEISLAFILAFLFSRTTQNIVVGALLNVFLVYFTFCVYIITEKKHNFSNSITMVLTTLQLSR